ncbi:MAG: eukaryotic-like serine/threonine-protein kinase [Frankiales bacterium]|nr:eukaryotic-like serine/threonine-protein kinase [Frankiales bacterium]
MAQGMGPGEPSPPVVAGFRVESLVGFGGCGEVWRARDVLTGRLVALKRLRHDGPPAERDRLRREAAVLAGLSSPHIVRLLTVVTSAQGLILVLEFQGGGSLASLLRVRPRLSPGEVVTIAAPVAAALAEVHETGLVHGDISPANLLFATDGRPVMSDLGVARLAGRAGAEAVTAGYTDPAVLHGAPLTRAADVYALAAVCFEALGGRPPFPGEDAASVLKAVAAGRPTLGELAPDLPAALADAVEWGLSADVERRPDAAAFGARLLESCAPVPVRLAGASVPTSAPPTAAVRRLPEPPTPVEPVSSRAERLAATLGRVRLTPRRLAAATAAPVALAGAIWGGVAWARSSSPVGPGAVAWGPTGASPASQLGAVSTAATAPFGPPVVPRGPAARATRGSATSVPRPSAGTPKPLAVTRNLTIPAPRTAVGAASPARPPAPAAPPHRTAAPTAISLSEVTTEAMLGVIGRLDDRRDGAFAAGDRALLDQVYAPASAPLAADRARLTAMLAAGDHAQGLALTVRTLELVGVSPKAVQLRVADELGPYALVDAAGTTVRQLPARPLTTWAMTLVRVAAGEDGWRIVAIARA